MQDKIYQCHCPYCHKVKTSAYKVTAWRNLEDHLIKRHPKAAFEDVISCIQGRKNWAPVIRKYMGVFGHYIESSNINKGVS